MFSTISKILSSLAFYGFNLVLSSQGNILTISRKGCDSVTFDIEDVGRKGMILVTFNRRDKDIHAHFVFTSPSSEDDECFRTWLFTVAHEFRQSQQADQFDPVNAPQPTMGLAEAFYGKLNLSDK